jgi:hypothetical protein
MHRLKMPLPSQRLSFMEELTFAVGDTIHDVVKSKAAAGAPKSAYGKWQCHCKHTTSEECTYEEALLLPTCTVCGTTLSGYRELDLVHAELGIVGHPDLVFLLQAYQAFYVTELKSISAEQYKELTRPKPDHILQVVMYWWLMRELGRPVLDRVSVLYITKGYVFKGAPYKEYAFDPQEHLDRLTPYIADARAFAAFLRGAELPPRTFCKAETSPDAKSCEVSSHCFGSACAPTRVSFSSATSPTRR